MQRSAMFEADETGNVLNENGARFESVDIAEVFAEKMIPWILVRTDRRVDGKTLAWRATRKEVQFAN